MDNSIDQVGAVIFVEKKNEKLNGTSENIFQKAPIFLWFLFGRYQYFRHILQNPQLPKNIIASIVATSPIKL